MEMYRPMCLEILRFDRTDILTTSSYTFSESLDRKYQTDLANSPWGTVPGETLDSSVPG